MDPSGASIESAGDFTHVRPGDTVVREFYGMLTTLVVTEIDDELIYTGEGWWTFDRRTGFEHDPELGVGWRFGVTISRLVSSQPAEPDRSAESGVAQACEGPQPDESPNWQ